MMSLRNPPKRNEVFTMSDTDKNAKRIGRNITNLLIEHEKTQQELANAIGVSKSTVSTWTNGKRIPRMSKVDKMCKFFGVPRSAILGDVVIDEDPSVIFHNAVKSASRLPMPGAEDEFRRRVLEIINENQQPQYYDDEVVQIVTDRLRTNPQYSVLFKASANVRPEDIDLVAKFIEKFSD